MRKGSRTEPTGNMAGPYMEGERLLEYLNMADEPKGTARRISAKKSVPELLYRFIHQAGERVPIPFLQPHAIFQQLALSPVLSLIHI